MKSSDLMNEFAGKLINQSLGLSFQNNRSLVFQYYNKKARSERTKQLHINKQFKYAH